MKKMLRAVRSRSSDRSAQGRLEPDQVTVILRALERADRAARAGSRKATQRALRDIAGALSKVSFGTK